MLRPGGAFGPLLESFVLSELARQLTWSDQPVELYHYRDQNKVEVDAVLYTVGGTLPFGDRLRAMPVSALWQVGHSR